MFPDLSAPVFNVIVQNAAMGAEELETGSRHPDRVGARRAAGRAAHPLDVAARRRPGDHRVRARRRLLPRAPARRRARRAGRAAAAAGHGRAAAVEPHRPAQRDLRVHARGRSRRRRPDDAARPRGVRGARTGCSPCPASPRSSGSAATCASSRCSSTRPHGGARRHARRGHARRRGRERERRRRLRRRRARWSGRCARSAASSVDDLRTTVVARRGATPVLLGDVADVREAPAVRRGIAHRLEGEVVSCRVVKQFGADTVKVAAAVRDGDRRDPAQRCRRASTLRIVYDQSELVDSRRSAASAARCCSAPSSSSLVLFALLGDLRAALLVTLTIPLSLGAGRAAPAPGRRRHQHDDARRPRDRGRPAGRRRDHRDRERRPSPAAAARTPARGDERACTPRIEVGRPIAFATLIVIAVFLPLFAMTGIEGRMYQPLAAAVIAPLAASLVLALTLVPVAAALLLRPARPGATRTSGSSARSSGSTRRCSTRACATPACVRVATLVDHGPGARASRSSSARDFMPQLDEGAFLLQTILPPEASLDEVDRLNHRVEDVLRDVPRGRGRRAAHRPRRAHRGPDAAHRLRRAGRAEAGPRARRSTSSRPTMREALREGARRLGPVHDAARHAHRRGARRHAGRLSVRIFGPDLDELARLGEQAQRVDGGASTGIEDLRAETLDRPAAAARRRRSRGRRARRADAGRRRRAIRVGLVGEDVSRGLGRPAPLRPGGAAADDRRATASRRSAPADRGHDGTRIPLGQLATIEETFGAGRDPARGRQPPHRRRGQRRRAATSAAPRGRARAARSRSCSCRPATSSTSAAGSRARSARTRR